MWSGSATFILFKGTESVKIWLSTTYAHNMPFANSSQISIIFQYYQHSTAIWHKLSIYTPCVTALILSECTNSSLWGCPNRSELNRSELNSSEHNNLDPLLPTLCTGSSSLRGDEQHDFLLYKQLWAEQLQTALKLHLLQVAVVGISSNNVMCSIHYTTH